jgi:hypothetical protein
MNATEEISGCLVVASGNGSVLFEASEEVFDEMSSLVQVSIVIARLLARGSRRNHHRFFFVQQRLDHSGLGVVGLVGDDGLARCVLEQNIGAIQVMDLPWGEMKTRGIAQCIDGGVDLRAQPPSAAPKGLLV